MDAIRQATGDALGNPEATILADKIKQILIDHRVQVEVKTELSESHFSNVMPRFCFSCGSKLEKIKNNYYQCTWERCAEVMWSESNDLELIIHYISTPISPKHDA